MPTQPLGRCNETEGKGNWRRKGFLWVHKANTLPSLTLCSVELKGGRHEAFSETILSNTLLFGSRDNPQKKKKNSLPFTGFPWCSRDPLALVKHPITTQPCDVGCIFVDLHPWRSTQGEWRGGWLAYTNRSWLHHSLFTRSVVLLPPHS